ncbi:TPA: endonuclease [Candidatus Nomurabacteria bacterium]|nr:MAG: Endonuclease VII [Parcubacteria group bacterium GW2011_GWC1_43_30]KKT85587.1 MAG: Endonuclease VII [Parcubacteria group bacterium GW2011_GWD1_44_9]HCY17750.1 endonuclease [Candidatus Nomurabacteria bacterium]
MSKSKKKFVFAKNNIVAPEEIMVEKGDVGVVKSENKNHTSIFFIRIWKQVELNKSDFEIIDVRKTGDGFSRKICNVCHKLKKTTDFAKNQNAKNNRSVRRPSCKDCRVKMEGIGVSRINRVKWLKKKPHNKPFECPICKKRTIAGVTSKVVLEHDHRTGKPGGWICDSCNTGLGRFKDDVELLKSAMKFLKKNY